MPHRSLMFSHEELNDAYDGLVGRAEKAEAFAAEMKGELDKLTQELYDSKYIAANRKELLRRVAELVDPVAHEPGECEDCDLMREVMKELADD